MTKVTEFQRKTFNKTIDHILAFIPEGDDHRLQITSHDLLNIMQHCVKGMPDNELDAIFDIGDEPEIKGVKRSKLFSRDVKERAVGVGLLRHILGAVNEGEKEG